MWVQGQSNIGFRGPGAGAWGGQGSWEQGFALRWLTRGKVNLDQGHFEIVSIGDRTEDSGKVSIIKSRQCYHCGGPVFEGKLQWLNDHHGGNGGRGGGLLELLRIHLYDSEAWEGAGEMGGWVGLVEVCRWWCRLYSVQVLFEGDSLLGARATSGPEPGTRQSWTIIEKERMSCSCSQEDIWGKGGNMESAEQIFIETTSSCPITLARAWESKWKEVLKLVRGASWGGKYPLWRHGRVIAWWSGEE